MLAMGSLVGVAAIALAVRFVVSGFNDMGKLAHVASEFGQDIAAGRYDAAYARTSAGYRSMTSLQQFRAAVSRNIYLRGTRSISFNTLAENGRAASAKGVLSSTVGDVMVEVDFTEQPDGYAIIGVMTGGTPALVAR